MPVVVPVQAEHAVVVVSAEIGQKLSRGGMPRAAAGDSGMRRLVLRNWPQEQAPVQTVLMVPGWAAGCRSSRMRWGRKTDLP